MKRLRTTGRRPHPLAPNPGSETKETKDLKPDNANHLGGHTDYLSKGSDAKHHPFASDSCLVGPAVVLL